MRWGFSATRPVSFISELDRLHLTAFQHVSTVKEQIWGIRGFDFDMNGWCALRSG